MKVLRLIILLTVLISFSNIAQSTTYLEVTDSNITQYQNNTGNQTITGVSQFTKLFNSTAIGNVNGTFYFSIDYIRNSGTGTAILIFRKNGVNFSSTTYNTGTNNVWTRISYSIFSYINTSDSLEIWGYNEPLSTGNYTFRNFQANYTEWGLPLYQGYNDLANKTILIGSRSNQSNISDILFRNAYNPNLINYFYANVSAASTATNDPYQFTQQNLSSRWHMDDNLSDVSGNSNNGQLFNRTARHGTLINFNSNSTDGWKSGISGNAIQTDGVNDYVNVTTATSWDGLGAFTVGTRIKFNSVATASDTYVWGKTGVLELRKEATTNLIRSFCFDNTSGYGIDVTSNVVAIAGVWYNITVVYNGTGYTFYIDDRYNKSAQMAKLLEETTALRYWEWGGDTALGTYSNVTIDDAWGLRRAATLAEIQAAKNGTYPKDVDFYYSFNETIGTTANDTRTPEYVNGKYNTTVNFNGTRYLNIPSSDSLNITSNITIESFIQFNQTVTTDQQVIVDKRSGTTTNYGFDVFYNGTSTTNELRFYYYTGAAWHIFITLNANLKASTKYYVVVSFAYGVPSSMKIVVNDTLMDGYWDAGDGTGTVPANAFPVTIGSLGDGTGMFYGIIDEVIISNRSKSVYELNDDYYIALSGMKLAGKTSSNLWEYVHWSNEINGTNINTSIPYVPSGKFIDRLSFSINDADTFYTAQPTSSLMNGITVHDFRNNTYFKINTTLNNDFQNYSELYDLGADVWVNLTHTVPVYIGSTNIVDTTAHSLKISEYPSTIFTYTYLTNLSFIFTAANASNVSIDGYQFTNDRLVWNMTSTANENITFTGYMMNGAQNFSVYRNETKLTDLQTTANNYFTFSDDLIGGVQHRYNISLNGSRIVQIGHNNITNATEYSPAVLNISGNTTMFFTRNYPGALLIYPGDDTIWKSIKSSTGELLNSSAWSLQLEVLGPGNFSGELYQIADPDGFVQPSGRVELYYSCVDDYGTYYENQSSGKICHAYSDNNGSNWTKRGRLNISGLPDYIINPDRSTAWGSGEPSPIRLDDGTILLYFTFLDNQGHNGVYLINSTDANAHNFTYVKQIWQQDNPDPPLPWVSRTAEIIKNKVNYILIGQYDWHTWAYLISNDPYDFSASPVRYFWHSEEDILSPTFNTITPTSVLEDKVIYFGAQNGTIQYPTNPITYGTVYGASIFFDILSPGEPGITSWGNTYTNNQTLSLRVNSTDIVTFNVTANQTITYWNWTRNGYNESDLNSTFTHRFLITNGTVNISVVGYNENGNTQTLTWSVYVFNNGSYIPPVYSPSFVPYLNITSGFSTTTEKLMSFLNWSDIHVHRWNETSGVIPHTIDYYINSSMATNASGVFNITTNAMYNGNPSHNINVYIYNFTSTFYEALSNATYRYDSSTSFAYRNWTGLLNLHYRNATGITIIQFNHTMNGVVTHKLYIDEVKITLETYSSPNITKWCNTINGCNQTALIVNVGNIVTYNVTVDQGITNVSWKINGTEMQNTSLLNFTTQFNYTGSFNVTAIAYNTTGSSQEVYTNTTVVSDGSGGGTTYDWLDGYVNDSVGVPIVGATITTSEGTMVSGAGGYYSFGYLFIQGDTYWVNTTMAGYNDNNTQVTMIQDHMVFNPILTLSTVPGTPNVTSFTPATPLTTYNGSLQLFTIVLNQTVNVTWILNGTVIQFNNTISAANYTNLSGSYGYWNLTAFSNNSNGTVSQTWLWTVLNLTSAPITAALNYTPSCGLNIFPNNTNLAPTIHAEHPGTGERVTGTTYYSNNSAIQLMVFSHADVVATAANVVVFINDTMVSPQSGRPLGGAESSNRSIVVLVPRYASYRVEFTNYHHYEWREYPISLDISGCGIAGEVTMPTASTIATLGILIGCYLIKKRKREKE